jgi:hypothetical protein
VVYIFGICSDSVVYIFGICSDSVVYIFGICSDSVVYIFGRLVLWCLTSLSTIFVAVSFIGGGPGENHRPVASH